MLVRNTPTRITSLKLLPAASRPAARFKKSCVASASTPPSTSFPVPGSCATWPLKKTYPSARMACEKGPTGGASWGETIVDFDMMGSRLALGECVQVRGRHNLLQIHYYHYYNAGHELCDLVASSSKPGVSSR